MLQDCPLAEEAGGILVFSNECDRTNDIGNGCEGR